MLDGVCIEYVITWLCVRTCTCFTHDVSSYTCTQSVNRLDRFLTLWILMFFCSICIWLFRLWFSFGFIIFRWLYTFPLGLPYSNVPFRLGIKNYGIQVQRCASYKAWRSICGRKMCFPLPPPWSNSTQLLWQGRIEIHIAQKWTEHWVGGRHTEVKW